MTHRRIKILKSYFPLMFQGFTFGWTSGIVKLEIKKTNVYIQEDVFVFIIPRKENSEVRRIDPPPRSKNMEC